MIDVVAVRTLFPLDSLSEEQITPHLNRAKADFAGIDFATLTYKEGVSAAQVELEAIGCKCIAYLAPLLWTALHKKVNKGGEMLENYKDVKAFQLEWESRSDTALELDATPDNNPDYIGMTSV